VAFATEATIGQPLTAAPPTSSFPIQRPAIVLGLVLVLASLALYNPAGRYPFINYDDDHYITENPQVCQGLRWSAVRWAFTTTTEANWHPLTWLSHELDWQLFHLNPAGHHYVNVLFHAANAYLLFLVLLQATGLVWRSWIVAALFALHPMNVESVAWISERKNLLSMFFFLLALVAYRWYAQRPRLTRYGVVTILFALGLMAKPQVITFPFVLLLWDYWPLRRTASDANNSPISDNSDRTIRTYSFLHLALEKLPLIALSAASAVITIRAQVAGGAVRSVQQIPLSARLGNAVLSYVLYLGKTLWPSHLAVMYPYWGVSLLPLLLAFLLLALISACVIAARRRYLLVGWLWFLGILVPMIGLVQVGAQAMADRYGYLPLIGLFLMVVWGAAEIVRSQLWPAWVPAVACLIALSSLGLVARRQLSYWSNSVSLWSHTIEVTGPNFQGEEHLASALAAQGLTQEAGVHFERAVAIDPTNAKGNLNLAIYDQTQGNIQEAITLYQNALRGSSDPKLVAQALPNLAFAYRQLGNFPQAEATYKAALGVNKDNPSTWLGMGLLEQKLGNCDEAAGAFSHAAALRPSPVGYLLLEAALQSCGRSSEATAAHEKARQISDDLGLAHTITDKLLAD